MNPDACRDVMDRSRIPYEVGHDVVKVASGLDESPLRKQLPLRQQANKPMLKYNTSVTKSVHLFSQGDIGTTQNSVTGVNTYCPNGMYFTGNVIPTQQVPVYETSSASKSCSSSIAQHMSGKTSSVSNSNPYVRPVSATEVAANINGEKTKRLIENTVSAISEKTFVDPPKVLSRNSFLRPLSGVAVNKDRTSVRKQSHSEPDPAKLSQKQNSLGSDSSMKHYCENKAIKKTMFHFASTASVSSDSHVVKKCEDVSNSSVSKNSSSTSQESTSSYTSNSNPTSSLNKPLVDNVHSGSRQQDMSENYISYTPQHSNEFNEVKSVVDDNSNIMNTTSTKPIKKITSSEEESYSLQRSPSTNALNAEPGSLRKMPVTNTLTGTIYYRKASNPNKFAPKNDPPLAQSQNKNTSNGVTKHREVIRGEQSQHSSQSTNLQGVPIAKEVMAKPPVPRPTLERSNASIQLQNKPLPQETKVISKSQLEKLSSNQDKEQPVKTHSSTAQYKTAVRQISSERSLARHRPSKAFPDKGVRSDGGYQVKKGMASSSATEQRPSGDGAPSKIRLPPEKTRRPSPKKGNWEDEEDEDDFDCDSDDLNGEEEDEESETSPSGERFPGDGEASFEDFGDEEELDNFEEDVSDGESDSYSINSRSSSGQHSLGSATGRPMTSHSAGVVKQDGLELDERIKPFTRPVTASGNVVIKPAFRFSMFKNIPPTINFVSEGEKTEQLPWELRKLLKWKMSPITPIVVKKAISRVGFRISKRNHDWLGCFGKHMKAQCFKSLREYQMLNHYPGSFQIGRKDRLWRNLSRMQVHFGKREFNFFPHTYVLPTDLKQLKRAWEDGNSKQKWIIKPPASARGIGIRVISKWSQIPRRRPVIVQKYLSRPYLINNSKFDMRVYVYVSSFDPLRIYVYEDGLARFASCKYSSSMKSLNNRYMHLTNYSINKKNAEYLNNTDSGVCQGHKWSLKSLWNYMKKQGINTSVIWDNIRDLIIKTIICGDSAINSLTKANARSRYCCHELFGFDILLDENLKPWILEVNISPSLHSNSQLDVNIKGGMIKDLMNIAGFRVPDERDLSTSSPSAEFSAHSPSNKFCMDKRLFTNQLAPDERAKHAYFCQKYQDEQVMQSILDTITPDDTRHLCESIDEDSRKGNFQRLFPTPHTHHYLKYFEQPRYYNLLLDQWVLRYNRMEQRGIMLLQSYCDEGIHVENPTTNPRHQWTPPHSVAASMRALDIRPHGSLNSARGSAPAVGAPRTLKKLPTKCGHSLSQSSSTNSLQSLISPQLHSPSPIGPITSSPSR